MNEISSVNFGQNYEALALTFRQMGIQPTGNKELDRAIAEQENEINDLNEADSLGEILQKIYETNKPDTEDTDVNSSPWANIMYQLGLIPSGDEDDDYSTIMQELEYRMQYAESEDDIYYYTWLQRETDEIFGGYIPENEENEYDDMFLGASQLATVNFTML